MGWCGIFIACAVVHSRNVVRCIIRASVHVVTCAPPRPQSAALTSASSSSSRRCATVQIKCSYIRQFAAPHKRSAVAHRPPPKRRHIGGACVCGDNGRRLPQSERQTTTAHARKIYNICTNIYIYIYIQMGVCVCVCVIHMLLLVGRHVCVCLW